MILLMFSGGVDSTYLLYHYLVNTKELVHCHHINIVNNSENRWKQENYATQKIYNYCRSNFRYFQDSSSTYEFKCFNNYIGWDFEIHMLSARNVSGNLSRMYQTDRVQLVIGAIPDDLKFERALDRFQRHVGQNVWKAMHSSLDQDQRDRVSDTILYPIIDMNLSKKQIIQLLPKDLMNLTWSCRRPINGDPCGNCNSCKSIKR